MRGVRENQQLIKGSSNPELGECKGSVGFCPQGTLFFSCFSGFSLVLDSGGGLGRKVWSACEEFKDAESGINIGLMFVRVLVPAYPGCPG